MLGEITPDLMEALGTDVVNLTGRQESVWLQERRLETLDVFRWHPHAGAGRFQHRTGT